jgi:hypothetical protein
VVVHLALSERFSKTATPQYAVPEQVNIDTISGYMCMEVFLFLATT